MANAFSGIEASYPSCRSWGKCCKLVFCGAKPDKEHFYFRRDSLGTADFQLISVYEMESHFRVLSWRGAHTETVYKPLSNKICALEYVFECELYIKNKHSRILYISSKTEGQNQCISQNDGKHKLLIKSSASYGIIYITIYSCGDRQEKASDQEVRIRAQERRCGFRLHGSL